MSSSLEPALEFMRALWRFNHALELTSSAMQRRLGITGQQRLLLRCLGLRPGLAPGELATLLHLDPGTVSAALRRLEGKRLLRRRGDVRDRRRVVLELTAAGRAIIRSQRGTIEGAVNQLLRRDPRGARQIVAGLGELCGLLEAQREAR